MANRREFLQFSAATLGSMALPVNTLAGLNPSPPMPFYRVIYDERLEDCRIFAREARRLGAATHGVREDITDLWYGDLRGHLSGQPRLIAGLTTASSAFLLELLGHDVFHRQVFRGEHLISDGQVSGHRFEVPEYLVDHAYALQRDRVSWSSGLARLMSRYDHNQPSFPRALINSPGQGSHSSPDLVSWVIAPLKRG